METIDQAIKTKFQNAQQKAMLNIIYTGNWLLYQHAKFLKPYGLTPQQYNIMRILRGTSEKMTMNDIKCRMLDKTPNLTRLSDRLIDKGLVNRDRCSNDRRVVYLKINADGEDLLTRIDEAWVKQPQPHHKLTTGESEIISSLLDKIRS